MHGDKYMPRNGIFALENKTDVPICTHNSVQRSADCIVVLFSTLFYCGCCALMANVGSLVWYTR